MRFDELDLPDSLLEAVEELGFEEATAIQEQALPLLLQGRDVAGQAQTGTGKTACFLLAAMANLMRDREDRGEDEHRDGRPEVLVVAPTRELAIQIGREAEALGRFTDLSVSLCYGGTGWQKQARDLEAGTDVVVGTPGRLIDYERRGILDLRRIRVFVVDEADRMFDMGFIDDIRHLFRRSPKKEHRQSLLFSATLDDRVMRLAQRHMREPEKIAVAPDEIVVDTVQQEVFHVSTEEKLPLLLGLIEREQPTRSLVFVNMRRTGEELAWKLNQNGHPAVYMAGDIPQGKRQKIIDAYKRGDISILVATDVASRGIHVEDISHVFVYDVPEDPEDYVHRIGRTARVGAHGKAITLACEDYVLNLPKIEELIGDKLPSGVPDGDLLVPDTAGRFRRNPKRTYIGWPPDARDEREAKPDAGGEQHGDGERGGGKPRRGKRKSGSGRGDRAGGSEKEARGGKGGGSGKRRSGRNERNEPSREREGSSKRADDGSSGGSVEPPTRQKRGRRRISNKPRLSPPTSE